MLACVKNRVLNLRLLTSTFTLFGTVCPPCVCVQKLIKSSHKCSCRLVGLCYTVIVETVADFIVCKLYS